MYMIPINIYKPHNFLQNKLSAVSINSLLLKQGPSLVFSIGYNA